MPCTRNLSEMWSLWSASRPTIARPTSENIWHLSNTPTRRHLRTWSCDLLEPGSRDHTFSGGRSRAGGKMSVTLWRWFYIHILHGQNTEYKQGEGILIIEDRRCWNWKLRIDVRICCAIDPWCWAQLGRHQLLSVESQYKYHKLRTLNCRLEPSSQLVLRAWNDGYPVPEDFTIMEKRLLALSHF